MPRGSRIEIGDDVSRTYDLLFDFPFLGQSYRRLFLNSDGNLTFGQGDNASTERSLERFLSGPPRIALSSPTSTRRRGAKFAFSTTPAVSSSPGTRCPSGAKRSRIRSRWRLFPTGRFT